MRSVDLLFGKIRGWQMRFSVGHLSGNSASGGKASGGEPCRRAAAGGETGGMSLSPSGTHRWWLNSKNCRRYRPPVCRIDLPRSGLQLPHQCSVMALRSPQQFFTYRSVTSRPDLGLAGASPLLVFVTETHNAVFMRVAFPNHVIVTCYCSFCL